MTVRKLIYVGVAAALVLGIGFFWASRSSSTTTVKGFTLAPVEFGSISQTVGATGIVQPQDIVTVSSPIGGEVMEIFPAASVNHVVKPGDPLLKLDDRSALRKRDQAALAVKTALTDVDRAEQLTELTRKEVDWQQQLKDASVAFRYQIAKAQMQLSTAKANVQMAEARVEEARSALKLAELGVELTTIRVPASAKASSFTIIDRKVVLGQLVGPTSPSPLFTLASDLKQMQVRAQVNENDIGKLKEGLVATFTVYAHADKASKFTGKVVEIRMMPSSVRGAVYYETIIDVTNERDPKTGEWKLRPGMTATVDIILRERASVWKLPTQALDVVVDEAFQSPAARAKMAKWQERKDRDLWRPVWILDASQQPWPLFVRTAGKNDKGEEGITDSQSTEVLEWDPELAGKLDAAKPDSFPRVITIAPPPPKRGLFNLPKVKL